MRLAVLAITLPSAACFLVLLVAPRRRAPDLRRLAWLIVPATLVAALGPPKYDQSPLLLAIVAIAALLVVLYAIATLPTDPRVAIAAAVPLSSLGLGPPGVVSLLFVAATPLVLAVTVARLRDLRRRAPI